MCDARNDAQRTSLPGSKLPFPFKLRLQFYNCVSAFLTILFLIPYESYSTWVEAEFNSQKGEYSGERGRLNPYVNSNAQIKYFPVTSVGYPVVLLTSIGKNMTDTTMTSLIDNYFIF